MARYSDRVPDDHSTPWNIGPGHVVNPETGQPWPGPDSQAHAVSGWTHPPKKRRIWPWILGAAVVLVCGVSVPILAAIGDTPPPTGVGGQARVDTETSTAAPARKAVPKRANSPKSVGNGTWVVGSEISAGTYRTPGAEESIMTLCSWSVKTKDGGNFLDGGVIGEVDSPGRVVLKEGNVFESSGCQPWTLQKG